MSETLPADRIRAELRELVLERAYRFGDFTLSTGRRSQHYVNGKLVLLEPRGAELLARWIVAGLAELEPQPVAVGGLELGAIPIACSVMAQAGGRLRTFIVRKQQKEHGARQRIEGRLEDGDPVVVVDDVITTGAATLQAIRAVEERGCRVVRVFCMVDRQEDTVAELKRYPVQAAMTLDELIVSANQ